MNLNYRLYKRSNESFTTEAASETIVIDSPVDKLGLAVCYDVRFPELFKNLVKKELKL